MVERRTFNGLPRNFPEWMDWFNHHGIDPDAVDANGWVERDPDQRRVTYRALVIKKKLGNGAIEYAMAGENPLCTIETVQLEAEPSRFPA